MDCTYIKAKHFRQSINFINSQPNNAWCGSKPDSFQRQQYAIGGNEPSLQASFGKTSFSYEETFAIVCHITLRELPCDAQDLIYVMSYLNSDAVSESMLCGIYDEPILEFLNSKEPLRYDIIFSKLLNANIFDTPQGSLASNVPSFAVALCKSKT